MTTRDNLSFSVTDFGPIVRANIDLRPLTVFVGPSNTGKSYLAILIYALHKYFAGEFMRVLSYPPRYYRARDTENSSKVYSLFNEDIESLFATAMDLVYRDRSNILSRPNSTDQISKDSYLNLQESTARLIRPMLEEIGTAATNPNRQIAREFGIKNTLQLVRNQMKGGAKVVITRYISRNKQYEYNFVIGHTEQKLSFGVTDKTPLIADLPRYRKERVRRIVDQFDFGDEGGNIDERHNHYLAVELLLQLSEAVASTIIRPLGSEAYYLPADRTGIMHAHRTMVRSIISGAPLVGIQRDSPIPRLSGVLADFLEGLISLDSTSSIRYSKGVSTSEVAAQIEKNILQGVVAIESSEVRYPEFFYKPLGWKDDALPLLNSSSMVSELAPVVLYLRHIVEPNNLLIIEEPESHLHPAMQVEFTRYLIAAVKKGVRVMLTTHSEWVLDELARLVLLSDLPESKRDGIAGEKYALRGDEVGVWLFEPKKRPKGSIAREISFDSEYAGFRSGFDDVAIVAHNDYVEIENRMVKA